MYGLHPTDHNKYPLMWLLPSMISDTRPCTNGGGGGGGGQRAIIGDLWVEVHLQRSFFQYWGFSVKHASARSAFCEAARHWNCEKSSPILCCYVLPVTVSFKCFESKNRSWHLLIIVQAFIIEMVNLYHLFTTRRSPVHRTFVTFAFTSLHFILYSLRIAITRHFLLSSKNSAQKKLDILRSNGIYHNYTDHNFSFLRQPVGRMTSKTKTDPTTELYLSNPTSRSVLPPTVR